MTRRGVWVVPGVVNGGGVCRYQEAIGNVLFLVAPPLTYGGIMNSKYAKILRGCANYHPGTPAEYEKPELHRILQFPLYKRNPKTGNIILGADGRNPRELEITTQGGQLMPKMELIPVQKPRRLKKGTPKYIYRKLKQADPVVGARHMTLRATINDILAQQ